MSHERLVLLSDPFQLPFRIPDRGIALIPCDAAASVDERLELLLSLHKLLHIRIVLNGLLDIDVRHWSGRFRGFHRVCVSRLFSVLQNLDFDHGLLQVRLDPQQLLFGVALPSHGQTLLHAQILLVLRPQSRRKLFQ